MSITSNTSLTDFLYARPTLLEGIARILDFGNTIQEYNVSQSGFEADFKALDGDWITIGRDLKDAVQKITQEIQDRELIEYPHEQKN